MLYLYCHIELEQWIVKQGASRTQLCGAGQDALISKFPSDRNADHPCINSSTPIKKKCCSSTALYRTGQIKHAELTATGRTGCVTGDIVDRQNGPDIRGCVCTCKETRSGSGSAQIVLWHLVTVDPLVVPSEAGSRWNFR